MPNPDVWIAPVQPSGPSIGFGLAGNAKVGQYSSGGYAWTPVIRPRRKPFLEFTTDQLVQIQMPLLLDGSDGGQSIEADMSTVDSWRHPTSATRQPPVLSISGPIAQFGVTAWVMQTLDWGDGSQVRRRDGALVQQDLTITLLEYTGSTATGSTSPTLTAQTAALLGVLQQTGVQVPADLTALLQQLPSMLSTASPAVTSAVTNQIASFVAAIPNSQAGAATVVASALPQLAQILPSLAGARTYVVRDGDTLPRIAARELGDYRRWSVIGVLNGIRDPRGISTNQRILLP